MCLILPIYIFPSLGNDSLTRHGTRVVSRRLVTDSDTCVGANMNMTLELCRATTSCATAFHVGLGVGIGSEPPTLLQHIPNPQPGLDPGGWKGFGNDLNPCKYSPSHEKIENRNKVRQLTFTSVKY